MTVRANAGPDASPGSPTEGQGKPWKIAAFTGALLLGLVTSQVSVVFMSSDFYRSWKAVVQTVTMLCLSFLMVQVGYEFNIDKSKAASYGSDYLIAMAAAGVPWLMVSFWLHFALPGGMPWSAALLLGRFSAPTSAGLLFSMLEAAGLKKTWLFSKARILAIFDDLDTILLLIPLKVVISGFRVELLADACIAVLLLTLAWVKMHSIAIPATWRWTMVYAFAITAGCDQLRRVSHGHIELEVLLPSFVLGCIVNLAHHSPSKMVVDEEESHTADEEPILTAVSTIFMMLVGMSLPSLSAGASAGVGTLVFHVLAVTVLMIVGKCFLVFCYTEEVDIWTRLALSLGMCPRGEVGAGIIVLSLNLGLEGLPITVSVISLAVNLMLSSVFVLGACALAKKGRRLPPRAAAPPPAIRPKGVELARRRSTVDRLLALGLLLLPAALLLRRRVGDPALQPRLEGGPSEGAATALVAAGSTLAALVLLVRGRRLRA